MSGVEPDSLLFCWEAVTKGTAAEGSRIEINTIPIEGKCLDCDKTFPVENYKFICPYCEQSFRTNHWWPRTTSDLHGYRLIERLGMQVQVKLMYWQKMMPLQSPYNSCLRKKYFCI